MGVDTRAVGGPAHRAGCRRHKKLFPICRLGLSFGDSGRAGGWEAASCRLRRPGPLGRATPIGLRCAVLGRDSSGCKSRPGPGCKGRVAILSSGRARSDRRSSGDKRRMKVRQQGYRPEPFQAAKAWEVNDRGGPERYDPDADPAVVWGRPMLSAQLSVPRTKTGAATSAFRSGGVEVTACTQGTVRETRDNPTDPRRPVAVLNVLGTGRGLHRGSQ